MKKSILEGLLFVSGDDGLTCEQVGEILEVSEEDALSLFNQIKEDYNNNDHGIVLKQFGNIYKLTTKNEYVDYYKKLIEISNNRSLSQSALETLAIIAYNEPITRLEIDELRGINSSQMIRNLVAKDLIKEVGRSEGIGRPVLYGITDQFLDYFGISSKDELPNISFEQEFLDDIDLYDSKYKEE